MPLETAYSPNYFSIDDILATQERVPCKFVQDVPKLGMLNPAEEQQDLKSGTNLELPMWLALDMVSTRQSALVPSLPKVYKEAYREILKADASAVDLHTFNFHFFEVGHYAKQFDSRGDVQEVLLQAFTQRFRHVMDLTEAELLDPAVIKKLDTLELSLFSSIHKAKMKLSNWLNSSEVPLEAAAMVQSYIKRKGMEDVI